MMLAWLPSWLRGGGAKRVADRVGVILERPPPSVPPPIEVSINEAGSQTLNKLTKLQVAEQAAMTGHLAQIARDELARVRALYAKHGLASPDGAADAMDIIVCDDYRKNDPPPSRIWPVVAAVGLLIGGAVATVAILKSNQQPVVNVAPSPPASNTNTTSGFMIELMPPKGK